MWRKILSGYRLRVYIGYDSREDIAYQVAKHSIEQTCKYPDQLEIYPLKLKDLEKEGHYTREVDALASTLARVHVILLASRSSSKYQEW